MARILKAVARPRRDRRVKDRQVRKRPRRVLAAQSDVREESGAEAVSNELASTARRDDHGAIGVRMRPRVGRRPVAGSGRCDQAEGEQGGERRDGRNALNHHGPIPRLGFSVPGLLDASSLG